MSYFAFYESGLLIIEDGFRNFRQEYQCEEHTFREMFSIASEEEAKSYFRHVLTVKEINNDTLKVALNMFFEKLMEHIDQYVRENLTHFDGARIWWKLQ